MGLNSYAHLIEVKDTDGKYIYDYYLSQILFYASIVFLRKSDETSSHLNVPIRLERIVTLYLSLIKAKNNISKYLFLLFALATYLGFKNDEFDRFTKEES